MRRGQGKGNERKRGEREVIRKKLRKNQLGRNLRKEENGKKV